MRKQGLENVRRRFIFLLMGILSTLAACSDAERSSNNQFVEAEDAALNAAIDQARATIERFSAAFHQRRSGTRDFFVKKPFATPSGGQEHMWVEVFVERDGVFRGRVANEAEETLEVEAGDTVSVDISEISDWKYIDGNKLVGGYTIRYFLEKMSPEEREAFLKEAGFEL